ncbi:hypothetical protein GH984_10725, partial [Spiribacter sp. C176]
LELDIADLDAETTTPTLRVAEDETLGGSADLDVHLDNEGTLAPGYSPGEINVTSFGQDADATLEMEVGGETAGTEYDQLNIAQLAQLDGTLDVSLIDNFEPSDGDTFDLLTYAEREGDFSRITGLHDQELDDIYLRIAEADVSGEKAMQLQALAAKTIELNTSDSVLELTQDSLTLDGKDAYILNLADGFDRINISEALDLGDAHLLLNAEQIFVGSSGSITTNGDIIFNARDRDTSGGEDDLRAEITVEGSLTAGGQLSLLAQTERRFISSDEGVDATATAAINIADGSVLEADVIRMDAEVKGTVTVSGDNASLLSGDTVEVNLQDTAEIALGAATVTGHEAVYFNSSLKSSVSATGAVVRTDIQNDSVITLTGTTIDAGEHGLRLYASDNSRVFSDGRIASNIVTGRVSTTISNADLTVAGDLSLRAVDRIDVRAKAGEVEVDASEVDGLVLIDGEMFFGNNQVDRDVVASITNSTTAAGNVSLLALADQIVDVRISAQSLTNDTSTFTVPVGGISMSGNYAWNVVNGGVTAFISGGQVETTDNSGGVSVIALNDAVINARTETGAKALGGSGAAVSSTLALNLIGYTAPDVAAAALAELVFVDPDTSGSLTSNALDVTAYLEDLTIITQGSVKVEAKQTALLNATITNAAISEVSALFGASGAASGLVISANLVNSQTRASTERVTQRRADGVSAGGSLSVIADNQSGIYSNTKFVSSSVTSSDGGVSLINDAITGSRGDFVSDDGTQELQFGDLVVDDGGLYRYLGAGETLDLASADYSDLDYWQPADVSLPNVGNFTDSNSMASGGMVVKNQTIGSAVAFVDDSTFALNTVDVEARYRTTIRATLDAEVESSGGSNTGGGVSMASSGAIATNLVLGNAKAEIRGDSQITADGMVSVLADNEASIEAINKSIVLSGDGAAGVTLAFNSVGYEPTNLLFASLDALFGTTSPAADPAQAIARVLDSTISATDDISIQALNRASIDADLSNDATSSAGALTGASGSAASALVVTNRVAGGALAEIDNSTITSTGAGDLTLLADDDAFITAASSMKAISSTTNDAGASLVGTLVDQLTDSYSFTSKSGTQALEDGDRVRVASDGGTGVPGATYRYLGSDGNVDLSNTNYNDTSLWARVSESSPADLIPSGLNLSDSDSVAMGALIVRNDLSGGAVAKVFNESTLDLFGAVNVEAKSRTQLSAISEGIVESSGGSAMGEGVSLAVNGVVVTNIVVGAATAEIIGGSVTTGGALTVKATNDARLNALLNSVTTSGDEAAGVAVSFNTLGY